MAQESEPGYAKRAFRQARADSDFLTIKKAVGSVGFGVLRSALQGDARTMKGFLVGIVLPAIGAYTTLCLGELAVNFIHAPVVLDRQRVEQIKALEEQRPSPASVEFAEFQLQRYQGQHFRNNRVLLILQLRAGNTPITLHNWKLRSSLKPALNPTLTSIDFEHVKPLHRSNSQSVRLEVHDVKRGHLAFDFMGEAQASEDDIRDARHEWALVFSDSLREYTEPIPPQLYTQQST